MEGGRRVVALLLSGGSGKRLWPVSSESRPKQFLTLFDQPSLYQQTLGRIVEAGLDEIVVVANRAHNVLLADQSVGFNSARFTLVLEPQPRDSGPAVSAGVVAALGQFPSSTVFVALPCDHLIRGDADFKSAIAQAVAVAEKGCLVTFGIGTTHASTEYGYIRRGDPLDRHNGAFQAAKFHEKPSAEMAKAYHADSEFYWNSGILVFRGDVFAVEAQRHMPNIWRAATEAVQRGAQKNLNIELDPGAFARAPKTSIDHALLEKSDRVALIPAAFQWSEVGSWAAVYRAQRGDKAKNVAAGDVALRDVSGSLVIADGVRVIVVGAQDLVVAASPRGTFVAPLSRAGEVKMLIENGDI